MGADCCGHSATFEGLSADYKRRLWLVIAINATMFLVEMGAGALCRITGASSRRARFLRRCDNLWHQSCGHRDVNSNPRTRRNLEGAEPDRDGPLGSRLHCVSRSHPWHTTR